MARETAVAGEGPAEPRLPGVRGDLASNTGHQDQGLEHDGACLVAQRLVEELKDWHAGGGVEQGLQVADTEEHGDTVEPHRGEADGDGAQDGDGDALLWLADLLGHVGGGVEAGKDPVSVDETDDVRNPVRLPAGRVDERREDELGVRVGWGSGRHCDQDHDERDQRGVQGRRRDLGQHFAHAVEEECERVDHLVRNHGVPGLGDAIIHNSC